ncbi:MAG TPA: hypothetical protein VGG33_23990 [Polyangia bacterium]
MATLVLAWPPPAARAQDPAPASAPAPVSGPSGELVAARRFDHAQQLGLSVMPGIGYRMIVIYNEDQVCISSSGRDGKWVCNNDVPFFMDFALSYGLTRRLDLLTDVRLGVARDDAPGIKRQFALAPGIRFWLDHDRPVKFFTTLQAVYDRTGQSQDSVSDSDWGARNANGVMYDPTPNFGVFVQLGETLGFARWFRIEVDVGVGVQVRLP